MSERPSTLHLGMLVYRFPTASETFVPQQLRYALARGQCVYLYQARTGSGKPLDTDLQRAVEGGTLQRRVFAERLPRDIVRFVESVRGWPRLLALLHPVARQAGGRLGALRLAQHFASLRNLDVLHCQFGALASIGAQLKACGIIDCPVVASFHGTDLNRDRAKAHVRYAGVARYCDAVTVGSQFMWSRALEAGIPAEKLHLIAAGVDPSLLTRPPPDDSLPLVLLTVGRLEEVKGIPVALRAFARLKPEFPKLSYRVIGYGSEEDALKRLARELGIASDVHFMGKQSQETVMEEYQRGSLLVLSGVRARDGAEEGQGIAVLEAQACGLPVVVSDAGALPEMVEDGVSGTVVPQGDVDGFVRAIRDLLTAPDRRREYGLAARQRVERLFLATAQLQRLHELYDQLRR